MLPSLIHSLCFLFCSRIYTLMDIHEHGVCVDKKKQRVKCNYCGKEVQGFSRLKFHLGGVSGDVTLCEQVTFNVREAFRSMVMKQKLSSAAAKAKRVHKRGRIDISSSKSGSPEEGTTTVMFMKQKLSSTAAAAETRRVVGNVQMGNGLNKRGRLEISSTKSVSPEKRTTSVEDMNFQSNNAQKCIARFFYETGFNFSAVDSPGFREMMSVSGGSGDIPGSHDLDGWMLQEALKEVQDHVKKIKDSWAVTDSPAGPVYLKSFDVSDIKSNANALISLVDGVAEEVGVHNVVQIIACSTSGWVGELGKSFASNNMFWSVSISHCFELMLVEIEKMDSFGGILDKVNNITEFLYNNPLVWELFKDPSHGKDMKISSSSSEFEFVTPYLTLENVLKAKNNLAAMFASSDWNKEEGTSVSKFVKDPSFWESVERLVKSTSPMIRGLCLFSTANNQHIGYIYDTMDGIKESIAKELSKEERCYKPVWDVIDDVWNKHLHSPLHVTGYFLNPAAFYSTDFSSDPEVTTGFVSSLVHMVKECHVQAKISTQLKMYTLGQGCFDEASQAAQITDIAPAEWWAQKASQHPELQSFAIKILSQTCEGASRYKLKRSIAERLLLTRGMSRSQKKHMEEFAFVHYNLHLQRFKATY
ncbi:BnaA01g30120D [Brassica napus]|uniref:BnaA01g30120D protein n=1 Tax=Brassica napus TaxID=3708 RepID=A0A078I0L9_BRANA|nr:BnaA01g30120D [Brassica napus]